MTSLRLLSIAALAISLACNGDEKKDKPQPPAPSAPLAVTNIDQSVAEGTLVNLNGAASTDADGDIASFQWTQTLGPAVTLAGATTSAATFTAPDVTSTTTFRFQLTVTDAGGRSDSATATVLVIDLNAAPLVDAGVPQTLNALAVITLTGTATDPDAGGSVASTTWTQVGGPSAGTITNAESFTATVTAPDVDQQQVLVFQLTATDNEGKLGSDTVEITVLPVATQLAFTAVPASVQRNSAWGAVTVEVRNARGARIIGGAAARVEMQLSAELEADGGAAPGTLGGTLAKTSNNGITSFADLTYDRLTTDGARLVLRVVSVVPAGLTEAISPPVRVLWPSNFPGLLQADGQIEVHAMRYIDGQPSPALLVAGAFQGTDVDFDLAGGGADLLTSTNVDGFVARYAIADGSLTWVKPITGAGDERVVSVAIGPARQIVIAVSYTGADVSFPTDGAALVETFTGGRDAAFARLDSEGNAQWTGSLSGGGNADAFAVAVDDVNRVTVVGGFAGIELDFDPGTGTALSSSTGGPSNADVFVLELGATGDYLWHHAFGTTNVDQALAVGHTGPSGDPLVVGIQHDDAFFLRLAGAPAEPRVAEVVSLISFGGSGADAFAVTAGHVDAAGRASLAGTFTGTVDLDPGAGIVSVTDEAGIDTGFVVTLNGNGAYVSHSLFTAASLSVNAVLTRTTGNQSVLIGGSFRGDANFDVETPSAEIVGPVGVDQGFLLALVSGAFSWVDVVDGPAGTDSPIVALASTGPVIFAAAEITEGSVDLDLGPTVVQGTVASGNDAAILAKLTENGQTAP